MHVVVDTALVVEARRLPELAHHLASVVPVEQVLRDEANGVEACCVGLSSRVEAAEVAVVLHAALICPHLDEAVV